MLIKEFSKLPLDMQNSEVEYYLKLLNKKRFQLFMKRVFDISASFCLCIILSPIIIFIAIWIKIDSKGPIFYRQERITQYGKSFKIYKFRTMVNDADKIGSAVTIKGDVRITGVGKKIRSCRLDEIPQLFNILRGEMSFVGTRPEVKKYVDAYSDAMKATLLLPAGVTSLASIKFKNEDEIIARYVDNEHSVDEVYLNIVLPEKMKWNLEYLSSFSFGKDLRICVKTII